MADRSLRSRTGKMTTAQSDPSSSSSFSTTTTPPTTTTTTKRRNSPYLPTPLETAAVAIYPIILAFGAVFSALSPETRAAAYDPARQSHVQAEAPSYFARKDNVFNVVFVKQGWFWVSVAFGLFVLLAAGEKRRLSSGKMAARALGRWAMVTAWWVVVTQWCFGPPLIDRGFRFTGGKCAAVEELVSEGSADEMQALTAVACRAAGGQWSGGHDISGHVFLLVLGSLFLIQEVGWAAVVGGRMGGRWRDERSVVMRDGALKGAGVEAELLQQQTVQAQAQGETTPTTVLRGLGLGGQVVALTVVLCWWMLLMTAIYFHTWFEKVTGLLVALMGIYPVYVLPRWLPALRELIGLPGI